MLRSKIEMWFYGALIKISNVHLPPTEVSFSDTASSQDNNGVQLEDVKNITTFLQATSSSLSVNKVFQMLDSRSRQLQEKSEDSLKSNNECTYVYSLMLAFLFFYLKKYE